MFIGMKDSLREQIGWGVEFVLVGEEVGAPTKAQNFAGAKFSVNGLKTKYWQDLLPQERRPSGVRSWWFQDSRLDKTSAGLVV